MNLRENIVSQFSLLSPELQRDLFAAAPAPTVEMRRTSLARLLATGEPISLEMDMPRRDGETRRIAYRGEAIRADDGRITGARGTVADVTELYRAIEMFRAAFEENSESIAVLRPIYDEGGRFVDCELMFINRTARQRYYDATPPEALHGRRMFEERPAFRPLLFDHYARAAAGEAFTAELRSTGGDLPEIWSEAGFYPFPGGFVHVGRDITAARRAEQAARDARALQEVVFDALDDAIVVLDPHGRIQIGRAHV